MEEVVAKKNSGIMASYIVLIVLGSIISVFGIAALFLSTNKFLGGWMFGVGVVLLAGGITWTAILASLPKKYIVFADGKLRFSNGLECSPEEMDYCTSSKYGLDGAIFNWGTLTVSVRHTEYKFKFVGNVTKAADRLNMIKAVDAAQKQIAKRKEEENRDPELKEEESKTTEFKEENKAADGDTE